MKSKLDLNDEIKKLEEKKLINQVFELGSLNYHNHNTI